MASSLASQESAEARCGDSRGARSACSGACEGGGGGGEEGPMRRRRCGRGEDEEVERGEIWSCKTEEVGGAK